MLLAREIPDHTKDGINRFVNHGTPPGDFLYAFLTNNLMGALGRADSVNIRAFPAIGAYLHNNIPYECYGSPEKVKSWIELKRKEREANAGLPKNS